MRPPKTLDEIKSTLLARAGRGNPVRGLSREEVEAVVARLQSVDPDHWAKVWSGPAEPWLAKAKDKICLSGVTGVLSDEVEKIFQKWPESGIILTILWKRRYPTIGCKVFFLT
ncbi:MAG: hypothetical protein HYV00_10715 [Deltaproteobacteria bacterium]|nr:hypothetical protein [Deltaproteobacteria bacterium]